MSTYKVHCFNKVVKGYASRLDPISENISHPSHFSLCSFDVQFISIPNCPFPSFSSFCSLILLLITPYEWCDPRELKGHGQFLTFPLLLPLISQCTFSCNDHVTHSKLRTNWILSFEIDAFSSNENEQCNGKNILINSMMHGYYGNGIVLVWKWAGCFFLLFRIHHLSLSILPFSSLFLLYCTLSRIDLTTLLTERERRETRESKEGLREREREEGGRGERGGKIRRRQEYWKPLLG